MGERVVVNPAEAKPAAEPRRVVPLGYGRTEGAFARADHVVRGTLGGWRRVGFAFGVSLAGAGLTFGFADGMGREEAAFLVLVGGFLLGLTVPVRGLDGAPPDARG